jgi:hypothetical protein
MVTRRELVTGGMIGGLAATARPEAAADQSDTEVARAVRELRDELRRQTTTLLPPELDQLRSLQRTHLRGHAKFPDFIEVGIDLWERAYDWHIKNGQPLTIARMNDGRYTMAFLLSTLILRSDAGANYVGAPFDRQG